MAFHGDSTNGGGSMTGVYDCRSLTTARAHAEVRRHGPPTGLDEVVLQRRDLARAWLNADAVAQLLESMVACCFDDGDVSRESGRKYEDAGHRRRALNFEV